MAELRAVDVVPIDVASRVMLGVTEAAGRARTELRAITGVWNTDMRMAWRRWRFWVDSQHLNPDQVMQLCVLVVYGLVTLAEAWTYRRKGR